MKLKRVSTGEILTEKSLVFVAKGGEGTISRTVSGLVFAVKVYHRPSPENAAKLRVMMASPPNDPFASQGHRSIAWPIDLLADTSGKVAGFVMPWVEEMKPAIDYYNPGTRRRLNPLFHYLYLMRAARNIAVGMRALHERGCIVGDLNESNILVSSTTLATWVDTDSFQVRDSGDGRIFRCPVGKPEYTPPELQGAHFSEVDRQPEHDLFGLGVLLFHLLMEGTHPFSGRYTGMGDAPPIEERIKLGHFPYAQNRRTPYQPALNAPPIEVLPDEVRGLFLRCFEEGHRVPSLRPSAQEWKDALDRAESELIACEANNQHRYGRHMKSCPWCDRAKRLRGRDPFPSVEQVRDGRHLQTLTRKRVSQPARPAGMYASPPARPAYVFPPAIGTSPFAKFYHQKLSWILATALLVSIIVNFRYPWADKASISTPTPITIDAAINSMHFVPIPPGKFVMGSNSIENPAHEVKMTKGFDLQSTEVTQGQWEAVMGSNPSYFSSCGKNCPVDNVSWDSAKKFIERLNERNDGYIYGLPTEAEWEYAARAESAGDYAGDLDEMAWYYANSGSKTHPVAAKKPNAWGLYDMHGNVWEWCEDRFDSYKSSPISNPQKPSSGPSRVIRGCDWFDLAKDCQSSARAGFIPGYSTYHLGFRLRRTS
jgi:formylglycine-generating enzyme required for sulfatase activity